jgi:hypothetical protein
MKIQATYKLSLSKANVVVFGEFERGDVGFIQKWLARLEAAEQSVQRTGGTTVRKSRYSSSYVGGRHARR